MRKTLIPFCALAYLLLTSQNCPYFLYTGDTLQYEACEIAEARAGHYQYSREYQEALDEAIAHCDYFADGYRHKSVAYLKSGDFVTWMALMEKAIEHDAEEWLGYRAGCRYQFFGDYEGALADIERLKNLVTHDIGHNPNGEYHLEVIRSLAYMNLGQLDRSIATLEAYMATEDFSANSYDYLHLGVRYLEKGEEEKALAAFEKQEETYALAETAYYQAAVALKNGDTVRAKELTELALARYQKLDRMFEVYIHHDDKVFLGQLQEALAALQ